MCVKVHLSENASLAPALSVGDHSSFKALGAHLPRISQVDASAHTWRILNQVWVGRDSHCQPGPLVLC